MIKRCWRNLCLTAKNIQNKIEKMVSNQLLSSDLNCLGPFQKYQVSTIFHHPKADFIYKENCEICVHQIVSDSRKYPDFEECHRDVSFFPDYICAFTDAKVIPCTDAVITGTTILSDRYEYDKDIETFLDIGMLKSFHGQNAVLKVKKTERLPGEFIDLCYNGGGNIWHMTFDMISKFRLINSCDALKKIPLLMDERIRTNKFAKQYLNCFDPDAHKIVYLKSDRLYQVSKIYTVSLTYAFMRSGRQSEDIFFISNRFTVYARTIMLEKLQSSKTGKFFIKRGDKRLVNEDEVIRYLRSKGLKIVQPENYTFYKELGLFCNAELIVGSIGAAFTNTLYVPQNCTLICISPKERIGLVNSYATIAQKSGAKIYYCGARTVFNDGTGTPGLKFRASLKELRTIFEHLHLDS